MRLRRVGPAFVAFGLVTHLACVSSQNAGPSGLPTSASTPTPTPVPTPTPAPSASPTPPPTPEPTPTPGSGLSYNQDLKQVFDGDCIGCHSAVNPIAGYSMTTYASVLKDVRPGDSTSTLVRITRSNDAMYSMFSGNRDAKAALVYDWVVKYNAAQSR